MIAFLPQAQTSGDVPANDQSYGPATMSSREIAELTGKRHDHVIRDIRAMLVELKDAPGLGDDPVLDHVREEKDARGYTSAFHLNRELTDTLLTGYSIPLRRKVIARWHELESAKPDALAVLKDPVAMRGLLLQYTERVIAQDKQIAVMKPQVEALHHFAVGPGETHSLCVTDSAKHLKVKPSVLTEWLTSARWAYKRTEDSRLVGFQARIDSGHLTHKYLQYESKTGVTKHAAQVRITQKGIARIALLIQKGTGPGCAV